MPADQFLRLGTLRSGKEFSPYNFQIIRPPVAFRLSERLEEEFALRTEEEDWGMVSDGEEFSDTDADDTGADEDGAVEAGPDGANSGAWVEPEGLGGGVCSTVGRTEVEGTSCSDGITDAYQQPRSPTDLLGTPVERPKWGNLNEKTQRKRQRRREKRAKERALKNSPIKSVAAKRVKEAASRPINANIIIEEMSTTRSRWMGFRQPPTMQGSSMKKTPEEELEELAGQGYLLEDWDGQTPTVIADDDDTVIVILGGQPRDQTRGADGQPTYDRWKVEVVDPSTTTHHRIRMTYKFSREQLEHRRGEFVAVDVGLSFGGGQKVSP
jgi:hypothetical protein